MKAAVYEGNQVLTLREGAFVKPEAEQAQLNVAYCGICGSDLHILQGSEDKRMTLPRGVSGMQGRFRARLPAFAGARH